MEVRPHITRKENLEGQILRGAMCGALSVWFRVTYKLGAPHTGGFPVCGREQEYVCGSHAQGDMPTHRARG